MKNIEPDPIMLLLLIIFLFGSCRACGNSNKLNDISTKLDKIEEQLELDRIEKQIHGR